MGVLRLHLYILPTFYLMKQIVLVFYTELCQYTETHNALTRHRLPQSDVFMLLVVVEMPLLSRWTEGEAVALCVRFRVATVQRHGR